MRYAHNLAGTKNRAGYCDQIVKRNRQHLFRVLPKRWSVERAFKWLNGSRRLGKDHELRRTSAESTIHIAFAHMLLRRSPSFLESVIESRDSRVFHVVLWLADCCWIRFSNRCGEQYRSWQAQNCSTPESLSAGTDI
jgi:hypothetical protein